MTSSRARLALLAILSALPLAMPGVAPAAALGNTCGMPYGPNDPGYDAGEQQPGSTTWNEEQWYLFSCMPKTAPLATDPENASGMSVDQVWQKYGYGRDDVLVAYMEGGVNWRIQWSHEIRLRAWLNTGEMPWPQDGAGIDRGTYDLNHDGVVNVDDYANDPRVPRPFLHQDTAGGITTEDLIVAFGHCHLVSHRVDPAHPCLAGQVFPTGQHFDNDGNGYANDISGWNFHRDTNDPQTDQSVYTHSDDESAQAVAQADNHYGVAGICPRCRLLMVKAGDEAIDRPDRIAEAITYAVDSGVRVLIGVEASTGLTPEVAAAFRYAYAHNVVVAWASNDFDSADHTDGMFYPDLWPGNSIVGDQSTRGQQTPSVLANRTFRARSALTSYGPHALFSVPNNDGSTSTGTPTQGGVAALVVAAGLDAGTPLSANEVRQLVRSTASPIDDPSLSPPGLPGATFNIQYGYGRPNLFRAVDAVHAGAIPPTAELLTPDWYQDADPTRSATLDVAAEVGASRTPSGCADYSLQYGLGPQPLETEFRQFAAGHVCGAGLLPATAQLDLTQIPRSFWAGDYQPTDFRNAIERYDVTIRVQARDSRGLLGEDRRAIHVRHDDSEQPGFPVRTGTSGDSSPTMADLEGRGWLDTIVGTADGTLHVFRPDGTEAPNFPVHTDPAPGMDPLSDVNYLAAPAWQLLPHPRDGIVSTTAVGDLDHSGRLDIVAGTANGRVYRWNGQSGQAVTGPATPLGESFLAQTDRAYAHQAVPVPDTPYTRGASTGSMAAPVLADLEGTGRLDIVLGAWDGHVYAWRPDGSAVPGWPAVTTNPNQPDPASTTYARDFKLISTPSVVNIDGGDHPPDLLVALQDTSWPNNAGSAPVSGWLTAFDAHGHLVPGWPIPLTAAVQGYGTAQDFVTEGITSPAVYDTPTGPVAVASPNLFFGYLVDLRTRQTRPLAAPAVPGGAMVAFTTSPTIGNLLGGPLPQAVQAGSVANDVAAAIVEAPGHGLTVHNGIAGWDLATGASLPQLANQIQGLGFFTAPALADVNGDGLPDIIQSADSGALMAWDGRTGQTLAGFPKWTGGWGLYTPAVGDVTGGGTVAIAQANREGYLHMWRTAGLPSGNQAWHWHQDQYNSGHYQAVAAPHSRAGAWSAFIDLRRTAGNRGS